MMKQIIQTVLAVSASFLMSQALFAAEPVQQNDAIQLVKKGADHIKQAGAESAYKDFSDPKGAFVTPNSYLMVYDFSGNCLAHGTIPKMVGRNLISLLDVDGKPIVKQLIESGQNHPNGGWVDYRFSNPSTGKIEPKHTYCEKVSNAVVCGGVYQKS